MARCPPHQTTSVFPPHHLIDRLTTSLTTSSTTSPRRTARRSLPYEGRCVAVPSDPTHDHPRQGNLTQVVSHSPLWNSSDYNGRHILKHPTSAACTGDLVMEIYGLPHVLPVNLESSTGTGITRTTLSVQGAGIWPNSHST